MAAYDLQLQGLWQDPFPPLKFSPNAHGALACYRDLLKFVYLSKCKDLLAGSTFLLLRMSIKSNLQIFWNGDEHGTLGSGKKDRKERTNR